MNVSHTALGASTPAEGPRVGCRVVVLDDEPMIVEIIVTALEASGYQAEGFHLKRPFLDRIRNGEQPVPDLVITDICSPGMGGLEFLDEFRTVRKCRRVPVIVASGNSLRRESLRRGAFAFMAKPWDWRDLLRMVQCALAYARGGPIERLYRRCQVRFFYPVARRVAKLKRFKARAFTPLV